MKDLQEWKKLAEEDIANIIDRYIRLEKNLKEAGEPYNLNGHQVRNLLKEYGVKQRKKTNDNRKYKVNDDYFDIQSSNMAYILGFWAADGNIHSEENRLDLELSSEDYEILEKIKEEIGSERPIKVYQCSSGYVKNKLYFWSQKIKKVFSEYGIVPNKTYSSDFKPPYKLNKQFWIDYIRGFFDGDGCVKKNTSLTFELNSINKTFLEAIQNYLYEEHDIKTNISTAGMKGRNIELYRLYCYGDSARAIFNILYTPNSLFLERKYKRWLELM